MAFYPIALLPPQFSNPSNGENASGFILQARVAGTTTLTDFYSDDSGTSVGSSITLDSAGFTAVSGNVFVPYLDDSVTYKFTLTDPDTLIQFTVDNLADVSNTQIVEKIGVVTDYVFSNVSNMQAGTTVGGTTVTFTLNSKVSTLGYYSAGDGGAADYVVTNDTANDIDKIDLGGGLTATLLIVNPLKLSCVGASTSADSASAINTALTLTNELEFDQYFQVNSQIEISGDNYTLTATNGGGLKPLAASNFTTLLISGDSNRVEGLKVGTVDSRSGNTGHGILISGDDNVITENFIQYGATTVYHGIRLESANRNVISMNRFSTAPDNSGGVFTTQPGADIAGVDECSDNLVFKNVCNSGNCYGINFTTTVDNTVTRGNIISENIIDGPLGYGIVLYTDSSDNVVNFLHNKILNNTIRNVSGNVQDTLGAFQFGSGIYLQMCLDTVVMGNTINNVAQSTSGTTLPIGGITGTQCSVAIIGNKIKDSGVTGIYLSSGQINAVYPDRENSKLIIANNTIDGSDNQAIWVNNGRRIQINDNIILDCDSTAINVTSVNVSQFPRVKITGNMVSGAVTGCNVTDAKWLELSGNHFEHISSGFSALTGSDVLDGFVDRNCSHNATNGFQINSPIRVGENLETVIEQWQSSTAYSQATWVFNGSNVYRCITAGTSAGSGGPTGTGTEISDNTAEWDYVAPYYAGSYGLYGGSYGVYRTLDDAATPSVKNARMVRTGGTTTITDFTDQHQGQVLILRSSHAVTITHGSGILLDGNSNFTMSGGDTLTLCCFDGNNWEEIGRMDR